MNVLQSLITCHCCSLQQHATEQAHIRTQTASLQELRVSYLEDALAQERRRAAAELHMARATAESVAKVSSHTRINVRACRMIVLMFKICSAFLVWVFVVWQCCCPLLVGC